MTSAGWLWLDYRRVLKRLDDVAMVEVYCIYGVREEELKKNREETGDGSQSNRCIPYYYS